MNYIKYLGLGILFGIILTKAEIISWYRIYEMFQFQSFHMYGVIGSAVLVGILGIQLVKRFELKTFYKGEPEIEPKNLSIMRYLLGGTIFGLGWALSGACPGPLFILVGYGYLPVLIVIFGALIGTFLYGVLRKHLPH